MTVTARTKTRFLGWSLIGIIGGGAVLISLVTLALGVVVADVFVLEKTPTQTTYLTIVRLKGTVASGQDGWYVYEVKNADGTVHDAQLPWTAEPGDRVRMRSGRTRILHLPVPTEPPVLCSIARPCE